MQDPDLDPKPAIGGAYDYRGQVVPAYAPERDGEPDPGEVVWAWVPYEEDPTIGKDRPLVIVGRATASPTDLAAFMLSSKDRDGDDRWVSIGRGGWDSSGRESWARLDRVLAVHPDAVRREGATLDEPAFRTLVAAAARRFAP
jgi:hypothetical protein